MRARAGALPAAEIAVGGRGAALAGRHDVAVDADAHRAAGLRPFKAGVAEDAVEAFLFRLPLHRRGARRDQARHFADAAGEHRGRRAQILDARIGAGADEDAVDGDVGELLARRDAHIVERIAQIFGAHRIVLARRIGHVAVDRQSIVRRRAPGDDRRDGSGVERDFAIEDRAGVGAELRPGLDGAIERRAPWRIRATLEIRECSRVRRHHAAASAGLDRHVA